MDRIVDDCRFIETFIFFFSSPSACYLLCGNVNAERRLGFVFDFLLNCRRNQMDRIDTHTHGYLDCTRAHTQWRATRYISPLDLSTCQVYQPQKAPDPFSYFILFFAGISYIVLKFVHCTTTLSLSLCPSNKTGEKKKIENGITTRRWPS